LFLETRLEREVSSMDNELAHLLNLAIIKLPVCHRAPPRASRAWA
jgi:hypothetical protein